jgi:RimJ/RimL family protein N-acetyltransferase
MEYSKILGEKYKLIPFSVSDISDDYISWLNNPDVNKFLEVRKVKQTLETVLKYINEINKNEEKYIWGIYPLNGSLIGTITLNCMDKNSEIGLMIGDVNYWGKLASEESIGLILNFAFMELRLNSVTGGCYSTNIGMIFTFKRLGFYRNNIIKSQLKTNNHHVDIYKWIMHSDKWKNGEKYCEISV